MKSIVHAWVVIYVTYAKEPGDKAIIYVVKSKKSMSKKEQLMPSTHTLLGKIRQHH